MFSNRRIDDPVGACSVHLVGGMWGEIAVGLFAQNPFPLTTTGGRSGLFMGTSFLDSLCKFNWIHFSTGGGFYMLGVQMLSVICLFFWGLLATYPIIWSVNKLIPIRLTPEEEVLGCDIVEHYIDVEKEDFQPLDRIQFVGPNGNLNLPSNLHETKNEFENLSKRKPFHTNFGYEREIAEQQNSSARL